MPRLTLSCLLTSGLLSLCSAAPASAQQQEVTIAVQPITEGVAMITGSGGNIGLVYGAGQALLIDDQFAPLTEGILAAVAGETEAPVTWVVNTHWHGDHTGGNENLAGQGATIVAHENVRARMSTEQVREAFGRVVPESPPQALPVVTFKGGLSLHLGAQRIDLHHVSAAHTDGDSLVYLERANVMHMGDVFFNGIYPFIDTGSGGSVDGVLAAVGKALELTDDDTTIIPGHGPLAGRTDLVAYRTMLSGVRAAVLTLLQDGKSIDEVVAAKPSAPWDDVWGGGFMNADRFVAIVAGSLPRR